MSIDIIRKVPGGKLKIRSCFSRAKGIEKGELFTGISYRATY
ncbi:hypothetical protein D1AOALGA4SA_8127 [Olavius algarvensis Delta 1 endosymbiont]|nr:hypothetical protein D1AOALGA4SA_8127 [Olavius algarvensis Delta 1 endosymbiont]